MGEQTIVNLILGLLGVAGTFAAVWLARRGKREEVKQAIIKQEFEQQNSAFDQISSLADRYKQDATDAREREMKTREEWEARWSRQMDRCRKVTDAAAEAIVKIMRRPDLTQRQREESEAAMRDIQQHRDEDHNT